VLRLTLRFESSWVNRFASGSGAPALFTSDTQLKASTKGLVPVEMDPATAGQPGARLAYLQRLQAANPALLYRVPDDFDNTVRGVLARLVGEVRRLSWLREHRPEHLALRAFAAGRYTIKLEHAYSSTMRLTTPANDVRSKGAGLIRDNPLYGDTDLSRWLFGHLEYDVEDMLAILGQGQLPEGRWTARSPSQLIARLEVLLDQQKSLLEGARRQATDGDYPYASLFALTLDAFSPALHEQIDAQLDRRKAYAANHLDQNVNQTIEDGVLESWHLAGAVIVARLRSMDEAERTALIERGVLSSKSSGLSGLSMTGQVGHVTPKDLYRSATGQPAVSRRMPYSVNLPGPVRADGRNERIDSGVLVHSGHVEFELDGDEVLERELVDAIQAASVGPLHFGKKGVAWVSAIDHRSNRGGARV